MRRAVLAIALCAVAATAAGCGFKQEPTGARSDVVYPVTVADAASREVTLARRPARVVTLGAGPGVLLSRIGARPVRLAATASNARIRAARPGLIVLPEQLAGRAGEIARAAKAPTYVLPGADLPGVEQAVAELGLATDHALGGRNVALALRSARRDLTQRVTSEPRTPVWIDAGLGITESRRTPLTRLVIAAGGRPVGISGAQPVAPRRLARLAPAVVIATTASGESLERLRASSRTRSLPAVQQGRVLVVDEDRASDPADAYVLLRELAHALHPDVVS